MEIQIHELISWGVTIVVTLSAILSWWHKRKKHSSDYMIIQGLLRSINEHQKYFGIIWTDINDGKLQPTKDLLISIIHASYAANAGIMQQVLGVIKAIGVKKDVPFDAQEFVKPIQQIPIPKQIEKKQEVNNKTNSPLTSA
jgi:hypothetical protein